MKRFWDKIRKSDDLDGCWEWTGYRQGCGHGMFKLNGRMHNAQRVAWMLTKGIIPKGMCVFQRCYNRACVNPEHLFLGEKNQRDSMEERFWRKVNKVSPEQCWNWMGALDGKGYGYFRFEGKMILAHRVAWQLEHGSIPKNKCVLHKCDNPLCVNPGHLFLGTQVDNIQDMISKDRKYKKLSDEDVQKIRKRYAYGGISYSDLGKEYGVVPQQIGKIVRREQWTNVE